MDLKSIAEAYQSVYEKKLDPVGKEDGDVDNDGDKDSSDSYLMKRRKAIAKAMKKEETAVAEHHQKDADGKVIEHEVRQEDQELYKAFADAAPSSVEEEKTVLSKLTENGEELDMFDAVVAYLIDEGFAETLEEAQKIMSGLKPELVEEVYQSQLEKIQKSTPSENDEVQQMDEFVSAALGALNTANKVANVVNTASAMVDKMKKKKDDNVDEMARVLVPKDGANVRRAPKPDTPPKPSPDPKPVPKPVPPKPSPKPDTAPEPEKKPESPRTGKPKPVPPRKPPVPLPRPKPQPRPL